MRHVMASDRPTLDNWMTSKQFVVMRKHLKAV